MISGIIHQTGSSLVVYWHKFFLCVHYLYCCYGGAFSVCGRFWTVFSLKIWLVVRFGFYTALMLLH